MRKKLRKHLSPMFLVMLLIASALWLVKKMNYDYTSSVPLVVEALGQRVTVDCTATGSGYRLFAFKTFIHPRIRLKESDLQQVTGADGESGGRFERYTIDPFAFQNAISVQLADFAIVSVGALPEIVVPLETPAP